MAETTTEQTQTPDPALKGLPEGVGAQDTQTRTDGAPQQPVVNNTAPVKEPTAEEQAAAKAKEVEAQQAATAAEKAKQEELAKQPPATEFPSYGDEAADAACLMMKEAGVTPVEATAFFEKAIESGDLSQIDMAGLTAKVGKEKATMIALTVKDYYSRTLDGFQKSVDAVFEEVGGKENWAKVLAWSEAKRKTDPAYSKQADEFNRMMELSPVAARIAAKELRSIYEKDAGNSSLVRKQVHGDFAATNAQTNFQPITRRDYVEQIKVAHAKGDKGEVNRLRAQREATRKTFQ